MKLFNDIQHITDIITCSMPYDAQELNQDLLSLRHALLQYYKEQVASDERLLKLLDNLIFYVSDEGASLPYRSEILSALATTFYKTADFDLNIRPDAKKVKQRNDDIIRYCESLKSEKKLPVEEQSDKPYDITIFMATYNQLELTKLCLQSIFDHTNDVTYELFLIDNGSTDGTFEYFKDNKSIKLIRLVENVGLLPALHVFYESYLDSGKFWLYMNNDVVVTPRWALNMLTCIKSDAKIASVMPTTNRAAPFVCIDQPFGLYDLEQIYEFGETFNISQPAKWQDWIIYYGFVLLSRPSVRRKLGYYEDGFYFSFYYSDGDVILSQLKAGYRAVQARDTYVHHFDGGHTVLQHRRKMLASGEKHFFKKYDFFPTDIEKTIPTILKSGTETYQNVLFAGSSRLHVYLQAKAINNIYKSFDKRYFATDTYEFLKLEQFGEDIAFEPIESWYDIDKVFEGEQFDAIIYQEDILKLRNPRRFLANVFKRLRTNGRLFFISENSGSLLAMNYILMSKRTSPRDEIRVRKNCVTHFDELLHMVLESGFTLDKVEDYYYNETFTYANLDTIENYRHLLSQEDVNSFERNIRVPGRNICIRKPITVNTQNTLEELLYKRKRG